MSWRNGSRSGSSAVPRCGRSATHTKLVLLSPEDFTLGPRLLFTGSAVNDATHDRLTGTFFIRKTLCGIARGRISCL